MKKNIIITIAIMLLYTLINLDAVKAQEGMFTKQQIEEARATEDIVIGQEAAPVTIYEYASLTCSHCAKFHENTFYELKAKYIDTGKVKFVLREFPLDGIAQSYAVLARCVGKDKFYNVYDVLLSEQKNWSYTDQPLETFKKYARKFGLDAKGVQKCLSNEELIEKVYQSYENAAKILSVNSTPTFFVNGRKIEGAISIEKISEVIEENIKN